MSFGQNDLIQTAVKHLQSNEIILYPTDTIWGLGCNPHHAEAVRSIFEIKGRPFDKPLLLLVASFDMLRKYVADVHPKIDKLLLYSQRPVSVIFQVNPSQADLSPGLVSQNNTICIRLCQKGPVHELISQYGYPIVSTSANLHGAEPPASYLDISQQIKTSADYILKVDDESFMTGRPSSIVRLDAREKEFEFIR